MMSGQVQPGIPITPVSSVRFSLTLPSVPVNVAVAVVQLVKVMVSRPHATGTRSGAWKVPEFEKLMFNVIGFRW